jgi:hypothetical protein
VRDINTEKVVSLLLKSIFRTRKYGRTIKEQRAVEWKQNLKNKNHAHDTFLGFDSIPHLNQASVYLLPRERTL